MATLSVFVPLLQDQPLDLGVALPAIREAAAKRGVTISDGATLTMRYAQSEDGLYGARLEYETDLPCPAT